MFKQNLRITEILRSNGVKNYIVSTQFLFLWFHITDPRYEGYVYTFDSIEKALNHVKEMNGNFNVTIRLLGDDKKNLVVCSN